MKSCVKKGFRVPSRVGLALTVSILLTSCGSEQESLETYPIDNADSDLQISLTDYRFGSREVGGQTVQQFTLANVGVDTYPINSIKVAGADPEHFQSGVHAVTLRPGDTYQFDVKFQPLSAGQKEAALDIDYDTIEGSGSRETEVLYYNARGYEREGDLTMAADTYRRYINAGPSTPNKVRAMTKLPVLEEADIYGTDEGFDLYLGALTLRDEGDLDQAELALSTIAHEYPDSYLADDALYMLGYMQMIDFDDYESGLQNMTLLLEKYPDSSYLNTALYSQGIAQAELGRHEQARETLKNLADRHTAMDLGLYELRWPKDNYVSRMWFKKSEELLATLP